MTPLRNLGVAVLLVACAGCHSRANEREARKTVARVAGAGGIDASEPRQGRTVIDAKALSLQELIESADRIFRGRVLKIETKTVRLSDRGDNAEAVVRDVTVHVTDGLKNVENGQDIVIRQLVTVSAPLKEQDQILWFLPKDSRLGLAQPLGVFSGDFRIQQIGDTEVANNLQGNAGLWKGSLWSGDGFNRDNVLHMARYSLALPAARVKTIEAAGDAQPDHRDIPVDLLTAAIKSRVKQ
jgi:hypothetical protein